MGVDVLLVGPMPTPGIAFITQNMRADAGVVISASHNPYQDNGIKIFSRDGFKIPDEVEDAIESLLTTERIRDIRPTAAEIGKAFRIDDALGRYIVFCKNTFPDELTLNGMRLALDCANGAAYKIAPVIFSELGAEVLTINNHPNGTNINHECGAMHPEALARMVRETGADIGLSFDGDGDRMIPVDETGAILTGDHVMAICARRMQEANLLKNNLVVCTPMSNLGFRMAMRKNGIRLEDADVGDRFVLRLMLEHDAMLGGEDSGHIIFRHHHTTGDGIISGLQLLAAMRASDKPLSELAKIMTCTPQKLLNIPVTSKPPLHTLPGFPETLRAVEQKLGERGRALVRYSGTQKICRVMVEAAEEAMVKDAVERLAAVITAAIGEAV